MRGEKWPECEYALKPLCNRINLRKFKETLAGLMKLIWSGAGLNPPKPQLQFLKTGESFHSGLLGGILRIFQLIVTSRIERFHKPSGCLIPMLPTQF